MDLVDAGFDVVPVPVDYPEATVILGRPCGAPVHREPLEDRSFMRTKQAVRTRTLRTK